MDGGGTSGISVSATIPCGSSWVCVGKKFPSVRRAEEEEEVVVDEGLCV